MLAFLAVLEADRDRALLEQFYHDHRDKLYAVSLNLLRNPTQAEDAVQDAMVHIARSFETFKEIYTRSVAESARWSVTIVKNAARDILRREGRLEALEDHWDIPDPNAAAGDGYARLVEIIRAMPGQYREVLELYLVQEQSARGIAARLGLSERTVYHRIAKGREQLLRQLRKEGYTYDGQ